MKKYLLGIAAVCAIFFLQSCYYDNFERMNPNLKDCDTTGVMSFAGDIKPILDQKCGTVDGSCHNTGSVSGADFSTYASVKSYIDDTGDKIYSAVIWDGNAPQMPKNASSKIEQCSIDKIKKWLDAGALDN